jgi:hypothetical protein
VRRVRRDLKGIARLQIAGLLTLDRKLEAALDDVGRLDSRVCVPPNRNARFDLRLDEDGLVACRGTIGPREDLAVDAA